RSCRSSACRRSGAFRWPRHSGRRSPWHPVRPVPPRCGPPDTRPGLPPRWPPPPGHSRPPGRRQWAVRRTRTRRYGTACRESDRPP
ncbi:hypothetical protein OHPBIL_OHPBIL_02375, partial [Dysosmobacter welbionis]